MAGFEGAIERVRSMVAGLIRTIPNIVVGLVVFGLFTLAALVTRRLVQRLAEREQRHRNVAIVLGRLSQWVMVSVGLLVAASIIFESITIRTFFELLGITGVAIGLAFRDILQNLLAGILLLLMEPFRIGDQIVVGEYEGTVEDIQTRATTIRTYDGRRVVVPNSLIYTEMVVVNTGYASRRLEYDIGISYKDDIDRAKALILEAVDGVDQVLKDPRPDVLVADLAPSAVRLRIRWWIMPPRNMDALDTRDHVLAAVVERLSAGGVVMPFPTQEILLHRADGHE